MEMVLKHGQMVPVAEQNMSQGKNMAKVFLNGLMEVSMKETFLKIIFRVKEFINGAIKEFTLVIG